MQEKIVWVPSRTSVLVLSEIDDHPICRSCRCSIVLAANFSAYANRIRSEGQLDRRTKLPSIAPIYLTICVLTVRYQGYDIAFPLELARPIVDSGSRLGAASNALSLSIRHPAH